MTLPVSIPNTFANATTSIPLANLDANFVTIYNAVNGIGNGAESLANVQISGGNAVFTTANATNSTITNLASSNVSITGGEVNVANVTATNDVVVGDDLTFTGTGNRITGDMSNATVANRVSFQSSTTNGFTGVTLIPNGTSQTAQLDAFSNSSDVANSSFATVGITATEMRLRSSITGTGTYLPMTFLTGGSEVARFTETGGYFRMASGSGGIQFNGDTAAANALDDYEEGEFTPSIVSGVTSPTFSNQKGQYIKIGKFVYLTMRVTITAGTTTGSDLKFGNLPFTVGNDYGFLYPVCSAYFYVASAGTNAVPIVEPGTTDMLVYVQGATGLTGFTGTNYGSTGDIVATAVYRTT